MCSRLVRVALTAFSVLMVLPQASFAQQSLLEEPAWLVTPILGLAIDEDADPSLTIAGALAHRITNRIAVEGELGHVFDLAPGDADVDSSLTTVHGSVLYALATEYLVAPYVVGGIGVAKFRHEVTAPPASIRQTEIGFNLGGGITYPLSDRTSARGDFRFFKHIDDVPTVWRFAVAVTIRIGE
jgi:hypothetical protein